MGRPTVGGRRCPQPRTPGHNLDPTAPSSTKASIDGSDLVHRSTDRSNHRTQSITKSCAARCAAKGRPSVRCRAISNGTVQRLAHTGPNINFLRRRFVQRLHMSHAQNPSIQRDRTARLSSRRSNHGTTTHLAPCPQSFETPHTRETGLPRRGEPDTAPIPRRRHLGGLPVQCAWARSRAQNRCRSWDGFEPLLTSTPPESASEHGPARQQGGRRPHDAAGLF